MDSPPGNRASGLRVFPRRRATEFTPSERGDVSQQAILDSAPVPSPGRIVPFRARETRLKEETSSGHLRLTGVAEWASRLRQELVGLRGEGRALLLTTAEATGANGVSLLELVAVELARHFSRGGRESVLLFDGSLPADGHLAQLRGWSDVALGWCGWREAFLPTDWHGVRQVACGTAPREGAAVVERLWAGHAWSVWWAQLRSTHDWLVLRTDSSNPGWIATLARASDAASLLVPSTMNHVIAARRLARQLKTATRASAVWLDFVA